MKEKDFIQQHLKGVIYVSSKLHNLINAKTYLECILEDNNILYLNKFIEKPYDIELGLHIYWIFPTANRIHIPEVDELINQWLNNIFNSSAYKKCFF